MSRNGSGTYSLPAGNPVVTGTTISSTWANNTMNDIASALTGSVASDGQTPLTGNLNLNTNKIINLADPTLAQDAVTKSYADTNFAALGGYGFKNRIINGAMVIDQRGSGSSAALSASAAYPVDRFACFTSSGSGNTGIRSTTVPSAQGFVNSLLITVGTGASPSASSFNQIGQIIEGFNIADFGYGGAGARTTTLSFWVRASITGTYCVAFLNSSAAGTRRSYVAEYSISSANSWEYKTVTIVGDTAGSWNTNNTQGLQVYFDIGSGSDFQTTANAWGNGAYFRTSNQTDLIATNGATFYLTGVQLEIGSTATDFDYRPYTTEFQLTQRYYQAFYGNGGVSLIARTNAGTGQGAWLSLILPVTMRAAPTGTKVGTWQINNLNSQPTINTTTVSNVSLTAPITSSGDAYFFTDSTAVGFTLSSEL